MKRGKKKVPNLCCSCCAEVPQARLAYLPFHYNVPGGGESQPDAAALVCPDCFAEANDPGLFPVHEALINMNLIRVEKPNMKFTPEGW
jgi:hypothetical protein